MSSQPPRTRSGTLLTVLLAAAAALPMPGSGKAPATLGRPGQGSGPAGAGGAGAVPETALAEASPLVLPDGTGRIHRDLGDQPIRLWQGRLLRPGADLRGADLRGADLRWANLSRADLTGADLTGADLTGAVLREAVCTGAKVDGARLFDADVSGAVGLDLARTERHPFFQAGEREPLGELRFFEPRREPDPAHGPGS